MLHHLSQDPYGIFAIILTPTRELAIQISEQIAAIGAPIGVKQALVIGGENMTEQGCQLARLPHFLIATPGRLRHHLEGCDPPNISKAAYLVLDEADRLLSAGFSSELKLILSRMRPNRRTLLFSATLTSSLSELDSLAAKETVRFDLTVKNSVPEQLLQQYIFIPAQVKLCYLVAIIRNCILSEETSDKTLGEVDDMFDGRKKKSSALEQILEDSSSSGKKRKRAHNQNSRKASSPKLASPDVSIIVFVGSCRRCEEVNALLQQLGIECTALHSMMPQSHRVASLNKFKSRLVRILIATDVASRGLDIPSVELVINVDLPKVVSDYIHRVGRTARAGRAGRALTLVTQYDVEMVKAVEDFIGQKLDVSTEVKSTEVVPLLNPVAKAMRTSQAQLMEKGFEEKMEKFTERKKKQRRKVLRRVSALDAKGGGGKGGNENVEMKATK